MPYPYIKATDLQRDPKSGKIIVDRNTGLPKLGDLSAIGQTEPSVRLGEVYQKSWTPKQKS